MQLTRVETHLHLATVCPNLYPTIKVHLIIDDRAGELGPILIPPHLVAVLTADICLTHTHTLPILFPDTVKIRP